MSGSSAGEAGPEWCEPPLWFEPYFRGRYRDLLRLAVFVGGARNLAEAEDAVQSVMVAQIAAGRWGHITNRHAFFSTAVVRAVLGVHRSRTRRRETAWIDAVGEIAEVDGGVGLSVWEDTEWVRELLKALPRRQRDVMALILDGLSRAEVAEVLGMSEVTVRSNLRHARDGLAKQLTEPRSQRGSASRGTEGDLR